MRSPNFFMIGAPKCGTSAMAQYLSGNPQVHFCPLKEPFFWADDLPKVQSYYGIANLDQYLRLFRGAQPQHRAIGEGSTCYVFSHTAVRNILEFNPQARILLMLRDPVQMVQSWHNELVYGFAEDVTDFEQAWNLQAVRAEGRSMPATCPVDRWVQYRHIGSFANHVEPLLKLVPRDQFKIVLLEEFIADPRREYHDICEFIGAEDDGRQDFPPVRESQSHVFRPLSRMIMAPPAWFRPVATVLRRRAHQRPAGMLSRVKGLLRRKRKRITLRPEFEQHLREVFAPEVDRLEDLLGRSLEAWRREPARPNLEPVTH